MSAAPTLEQNWGHIPEDGPGRRSDGNRLGRECLVANRLSEDPLIQVLVIEADGSNERINGIDIPFLLAPAFDPTYRWNFTPVPQPGLGGRSLPLALSREEVLRSVSPTILDYGAIAQLTGDEGWTWDNPPANSNQDERWVEPVDNHSSSGQFNLTAHGFDGTTSASLPPHAEAMDQRVTQTTEENPEFPFNLDTN
ncbi:hypothetical protein BDN71DRAFT_1503612 [Pleurotus eryngii]|uniref:Uncharacterized protein n=1 Tax=Pleurotus eryngii TaxID=5323 RepID=A0A9P6A6Z4_PLEER|nr:hypothetical protein BDN71DRAFT_1503612 [Pleurotus eryngii]